MATSSERLPRVDEHSVEVEAIPLVVWNAVLRIVERSFSSRRSAWVARVLGCRDVDAAGPRPLTTGSAFPGFHVVATEAPRELALGGRHRFSSYALTFCLDELESGSTRLRAETRAEFPGVRGRIYRGFVIGTGGHVLVTRRLLGAVKRRAKRA